MPKKASGSCLWFLRCENKAEWNIPHVALGMVPACERCRGLSGIPADECEPIKEKPRYNPNPEVNYSELYDED